MSAVIATARTTPPAATAMAVDTSARYNIYLIIHKALRGFMTDSLLRLGRVDVADACEVGELLEQLRALMSMCRSHVQHENQFVHPALERALAYASTHTASEHLDHIEEINQLERRIDAFEQASVAQRAVLVHALYLDLGEFVGENFMHMKFEETQNQAVLAANYSDAQLLGIEGAIVASIPPRESMLGMRWMIGHINAGERVFLLGGMKQMAPPEVFAGVLALARDVLSQRDYYKLDRALA